MGNLKGGSFDKQIRNALIRLDARGQGRYKTDSRKTHSNALAKKREMYLKDFARFEGLDLKEWLHILVKMGEVWALHNGQRKTEN